MNFLNLFISYLKIQLLKKIISIFFSVCCTFNSYFRIFFNDLFKKQKEGIRTKKKTFKNIEK